MHARSGVPLRCRNTIVPIEPGEGPGTSQGASTERHERAVLFRRSEASRGSVKRQVQERLRAIGVGYIALAIALDGLVAILVSAQAREPSEVLEACYAHRPRVTPALAAAAAPLPSPIICPLVVGCRPAVPMNRKISRSMASPWSQSAATMMRVDQPKCSSAAARSARRSAAYLAGTIIGIIPILLVILVIVELHALNDMIAESDTHIGVRLYVARR